MSLEQESPLSTHPAPPELIKRAEALFREYDAQCFWFWHPNAVIRTLEDIHVIVRELRRNGNRRAWLAAQELQRCL